MGYFVFSGLLVWSQQFFYLGGSILFVNVMVWFLQQQGFKPTSLQTFFKHSRFKFQFCFDYPDRQGNVNVIEYFNLVVTVNSKFVKLQTTCNLQTFLNLTWLNVNLISNVNIIEYINSVVTMNSKFVQLRTAFRDFLDVVQNLLQIVRVRILQLHRDVIGVQSVGRNSLRHK